jgi:hypothetical protein
MGTPMGGKVPNRHRTARTGGSQRRSSQMASGNSWTEKTHVWRWEWLHLFFCTFCWIQAQEKINCPHLSSSPRACGNGSTERSLLTFLRPVEASESGSEVSSYSVHGMLILRDAISVTVLNLLTCSQNVIYCGRCQVANVAVMYAITLSTAHVYMSVHVSNSAISLYRASICEHSAWLHSKTAVVSAMWLFCEHCSMWGHFFVQDALR